MAQVPKTTKPRFQNPANRKHARFKPDPNLPKEVSASNEDFWDSGWSRGHLAPAGNNKFSQSAMNDTFLLSNIIPQVRPFAVFEHSNLNCRIDI